jgi:hypothetical protein
MKLRLSHIFLIALAVWLAGCGGTTTPGAVSTATGRATATFVWPARTRLIPVAANAIVVTLTQGATTVATQILARPANGNTASATFNSLPPGTLGVTATAYPNANGTGTAQATATTSIVIQSNQTTAFSLTMGSTIDHLVSSPTSLALTMGQVAPVTVTAIDALGNTVLLNTQTLKWLSSAPTVASVDSSGNVTGVAIGGTSPAVQITVTETESSKSVSISVVVSGPGVLIAEDHFNYPPGSQSNNYLTSGNGGTGWGSAWTWTDWESLSLSSDNLTYGNLVTSGYSVEMGATGVPPIGYGQGVFMLGNKRQLTTPIGQSGTVVYFSILLRPLDPIGAASSPYYYGFNIGNLFVGKTEAGNYYGMANGMLGTVGYVSSQVLAQQNTTVFLVVRATFNAANDQFDLWVNPVLGQPLSATPDATKTDLDVGTITSVGIHAWMGAEFDELRIGTSYAAVAPTQ